MKIINERKLNEDMIDEFWDEFSPDGDAYSGFTAHDKYELNQWIEWCEDNDVEYHYDYIDDEDDFLFGDYIAYFYIDLDESLNEDLENVEITNNTTVVPQSTGAAEKESKTLWDRYMEATKTPEDAPLFGAKNQPTPKKVEEPKATNESLNKKRLNERKFRSIYDYIADMQDRYQFESAEEMIEFLEDDITDADGGTMLDILEDEYQRDVAADIEDWFDENLNESLKKKSLKEESDSSNLSSLNDFIDELHNGCGTARDADKLYRKAKNTLGKGDFGLFTTEYAKYRNTLLKETNESLSSKLTLDESLFNEDAVALQEKSVSIKNFLSDIGKIVYALDWYAGNISTNLENDKYAEHFDSPERLRKAAQVSVKALSRLGTLMSRKMGYDINSGGNFLDTSITKKPSAMSERIADLRNLLAEHSAGILVNAPDPRVKNNNNLKNEVSELLKGLRSSLGTLASEVSKVKQGETKGLFNKKFKESLNEVQLDIEHNPKDRAEATLMSLGTCMKKASLLRASLMKEYQYNLDDDSKLNRIADFASILGTAVQGALDEIDKIKAQSEQKNNESETADDIDESCNKKYEKSLNEDDDFEGFDIDTPDDNPEITDEMLQEVIDDVKGAVEEAEFTPEEVVEKVFDCIDDEECKYELAADVVKSTEEEMAEDELTENLVYGEATLDDYLDVIKKHYKNYTASEVIDSLFLNNPCMDEQTAFDVASTLGEMIEAMDAEELD